MYHQYRVLDIAPRTVIMEVDLHAIAVSPECLFEEFGRANIVVGRAAGGLNDDTPRVWFGMSDR